MKKKIEKGLGEVKGIRNRGKNAQTPLELSSSGHNTS